jgi:hypothetical protein
MSDKQDTQLEEELETELPEDGQEPEAGDEEDQPAADGEAQPEGEAEPEAKPETDFLREKVKTTQDRYSVAKKEADIGRQTLLELEADGLLDRDEAAAKRGMTRTQFDAYLDHKAAPEPGEDGHMAEVNKRMDEDYANPTVQKALSRVYGTPEEQQELARAFNYAMSGDAALQERFNNVTPEDAIYLVLDEGKAALEDYREAQTTGASPRALMAEVRKLRAENASLKAGGKQTPIKDEPEETAENDIDLDPLAARDARLKALSR